MGSREQASESFETMFRAALQGHGMVAMMSFDNGKATTVLRLQMVPVAAAAAAACCASEAAVLLFIEPPRALDGGLQAFERLFGLTRAEARVLRLLLADFSPRQMATELGVAITTVRSHLQALYAKTGTRRQSELVRVVAGAAH